MEGKRARKNLWCRVVLAVCAVLVGFILLAGEADAYVQDDLEYLHDTGNCSIGHLGTPCDLSGANLTGANLDKTGLPGANLSLATLPGANLRGANLSRANLSGANLPGAYLAGLDLNNADLSGANLS